MEVKRRREPYEATSRQQARSSNWLNRLTMFVVLMTCLRVWLGGVESPLGPAAALAQTSSKATPQNPPPSGPPFDATLQRKELIEQLNRINDRLDSILEVLRKGVVNVALQSADKPAAAAAPARSKG